jgi:glycosyltransferase involved in cell wall biosynthesis
VQSRLKLDLTMGFYFFPRGGSSQVARYLCRALVDTQWHPTLFAGSIGTPDESSNAGRFFAGIDCRSLDYSAAVAAWRDGGDAMAGPVPMAASFEEKPGVPDRMMLDLDNAAFDRQVTSWARFFAGCSEGPPDLVHLHHLTPMHEAARAVWPNVPVVTHLHGTELMMLSSLRDGSLETRPGRFGAEWTERMRRWAEESDRVVVVSKHDAQLVQDLLPVDSMRVVTIAGGVDTDVFAPRPTPPAGRLTLWKRWLVDQPKGWRPGQSAGSIRYDNSDLSAFIDEDGRPVPVVLFAGRFMRFKRLRLLIEAHHLLRSTTTCRPVLVIAGGFPCEWEDEHPYDTVRRLGAEGVFLAGWRDHTELAEILSCSDVFAAPAVDEPFGLVYLEAMASGIPPIATATGGPLSFINVDPRRPTGWLVPPDDVRATAAALAEATSDRAMRVARGIAAHEFVGDHYSWASSARAFATTYEEAIADPTPARRRKPNCGLSPTIGVA